MHHLKKLRTKQAELEGNNHKKVEFTPLRPQISSTGLKNKSQILKDKITLSAEKAVRLIQELEVRKTELESQNEKLRLIQKDLEESRRRYKEMFDFAPVGYFAFDKNGVILDVNQTGCRQLDAEKIELLKKPFRRFITPVSQELFSMHRQKVLESQNTQECVLSLISKDGRIKHVLLKSIRAANENDKYASIHATVIDITEHKKAEAALIESERRFRSLFEQAADAIVVFDGYTGTILEFNNKACSMLGYSRDEFKILSLSDIVVTESKEEILTHIKKIIKQGNYTFKTKHKKKDGTICDVLVNAKPVCIGGKLYIQGIWHDITEQKIANNRLFEYQQQLKKLSSQLALTEEHQRRRIARDIHDQVNQLLAITKIKLDNLLASQKDPQIIKNLKDINEDIEKAIQNTRTLTFDLSCPILYELGLEAAIAEWLKDNLEKKHGITTEFFDDHQPKPLDDNVRMLLFRNFRELLINTIKHAYANKVSVSVTRKEDVINITVEDNGIGLDVKEITSSYKGGFGLFSIRESLEELGGSLQIESKTGCGCKVTMTAPLKCKDKTAE